MIEVCICIFRRYNRINDIIGDLLTQTNQNFNVNIWNNSKFELDVSSFPKERIRILGEGKNIGSQARFRMVPMTTGTPIVFFDDDEALEPDFIQYHYEQYSQFGPNCILGWFNKIFLSANYWNAVLCSPRGAEVDYIGTGGMIIDRSIFDLEQTLQCIPEPFCRVEDLYLSYIARMKYGMKLISIDKKCTIISDQKDQYGSLGEYKLRAFSLLQAAGWRLLKESCRARIYRNMRRIVRWKPF